MLPKSMFTMKKNRSKTNYPSAVFHLAIILQLVSINYTINEQK